MAAQKKARTEQIRFITRGFVGQSAMFLERGLLLWHEKELKENHQSSCDFSLFNPLSVR